MPFISDAQLDQHLDAIKKCDCSAEIAGWDELISTSNEAAYNEILTRLVARGLTKAQVDTWARGKEFQRDIAAYFVLEKNAMLENFARDGILTLDRRDELDTVLLLDANGVEIAGESEGEELVGFGTMKSDSDIFATPDITYERPDNRTVYTTDEF